MQKVVESLCLADFEVSRVWEYVDVAESRDVFVQPVLQTPVEDLGGKIVGTEVVLANGRRIWATVTNLDNYDRRRNGHFATLSIEHNGRWFHLARYFDFDAENRSPAKLAAFLALDVDDIFPITYDVREHVAGAPDALRGQVLKEPIERLTRSELMALTREAWKG